MKETYQGICTKIIYALKGDEVSVIRREIDMSFVHNEKNGEKFHVRNERLSDVYVSPDPIVHVQEIIPVQKPSKRKRIISDSQSLFK